MSFPFKNFYSVFKLNGKLRSKNWAETINLIIWSLQLQIRLADGNLTSR